MVEWILDGHSWCIMTTASGGGGTGTISLEGQIGTSLFWNDYTHQGIDYKEAWTNLGFLARGAYH
jgi:hypothetical protein